MSEMAIFRQLHLMNGLMLSNQSATLYSHFLSENLPITIIPTSDPNDPLHRIG